MQLIRNQAISFSSSCVKGLAQTSPGLAMAMMIALLSLAGIPLTAGFIGKFYLFTAGFAAGWPWLVGWAVISSIISLFYYLVILKKISSVDLAV